MELFFLELQLRFWIAVAEFFSLKDNFRNANCSITCHGYLFICLFWIASIKGVTWLVTLEHKTNKSVLFVNSLLMAAFNYFLGHTSPEMA